MAANLFMVSLEPVELLDHHPAGRKGVRILASKSDRQENIGKTRIRSRERKRKRIRLFPGRRLLPFVKRVEPISIEEA